MNPRKYRSLKKDLLERELNEINSSIAQIVDKKAKTVDRNELIKLNDFKEE